MRFRRTALSILLVQFLWSFSGCCNETPVPYRYRWETVRLSSLDNSGEAPVETTGGTIPAGAYGIRMTMSHQQLVSLRRRTIGPQVARATSCEPVFQYIPVDTIAGLTVFALQGTSDPIDVTDRFIAADGGGNRVDSLDQFVATDAIVERMNTVPIEWAQILLIRDIETFRGATVRFAVSLRTTDGRILADTTAPVTLN